MEVLLERCAGLDVHQASVVCCVLIGVPGRRPQKLLRSFGTTTRELQALRAWLAEHGVTHVGMESTGVYWKPVYAVLEGHFDLIVGNAHHIKNVPGRKTDVKDAEWIAQLVRHGLITKSFVPPPAVRDLRDLVRYRRTLVETRTAMRNRVLKLLEGANIKLSGVASDVFGVSGMAMLEALAAGSTGASEMARLARGRMRRKHAALEAALEGHMREHQRFLLAMQLRQLEAVDRDLEALDTRIDAQLEPFRAQHGLLLQIPGVDRVTAAAILAEIGTDMGVFATARRLAAWAGLAPGNYESAGKPKGAAVRRGNVFLKSALFAAASAAVRTKGSYYRDKYNRLRARRGPVRALMAIAHKLLVAAFHMLATGEAFRDLGEGYLDQVTRRRSTAKLIQRLSNLGYEVTLVPKAA
ncbi:MAG TPA: IS110 family transposase [Roseococcus sp.]|nr:IS110 family transposase [Roseococcus sp.]